MSFNTRKLLSLNRKWFVIVYFWHRSRKDRTFSNCSVNFSFYSSEKIFDLISWSDSVKRYECVGKCFKTTIKESRTWFSVSLLLFALHWTMAIHNHLLSKWVDQRGPHSSLRYFMAIDFHLRVFFGTILLFWSHEGPRPCSEELPFGFDIFYESNYDFCVHCHRHRAGPIQSQESGQHFGEVYQFWQQCENQFELKINKTWFYFCIHSIHCKQFQISKFGIFFNHKIENRRALFYLVAPTLSTVPLTTVTVLNSIDFGKDNIFQRDSALLLRSLACIAVSMAFTIFIRGLNKRFAALNSFLRFCKISLYFFFWNIIPQWEKIMIWDEKKLPHTNLIRSFEFCFDWIRKQYLTSNRLKVSVNIYANDSIDVIKFIGRQHAFLTDITDQLNVCYSFQVRSPNSASLRTNSFFQIFVFASLDSELHRRNIFIYFVNNLWVLSLGTYATNGRINNIRPIDLAFALHSCRIDIHPSLQPIDQWSKIFR